MKKITKITLAVLGGVEAIFSILSPILIVLIWVQVMNFSNQFGEQLLLVIGSIASIFRAIKIGWLKE